MEPHDGLPAGAGGYSSGGHPGWPHACPKGLRHGFSVQAVSRGIALNMVQKWLGHAQLTTTAIYANAMGEAEQNIAARMWCEGTAQKGSLRCQGERDNPARHPNRAAGPKSSQKIKVIMCEPVHRC
jgi:hypothetical protein